MVITLSLNQAIAVTWARWDPKKNTHEEHKYSMKKLDPQHTYIVISSVNNTPNFIECIEKNTNVLFKSNRAVNKTPGHGTEPRNTIIVFEMKE